MSALKNIHLHLTQAEAGGGGEEGERGKEGKEGRSEKERKRKKKFCQWKELMNW